MKKSYLFIFVMMVMICINALADQNPQINSQLLSGLKLRCIGPALMSGRIGDMVKDPTDKSTWYIAVASGNVWKTENNGTTWQPIFDHYGSYSIGCITIDPNNPHIIWLGTGENNSQRSVGYGDGVYRSLDGGESWQNMGLKNSEHIGKILIDPRDSNVIYVASQGPLWAPGGDRGLYKSIDGGKNWNCILHISENTGISDIALDHRNPDVIYAASYQRRRHVGILIAGGPESRIYKSNDGGASWKKLTKGLPAGHVGRIGIAISPQNPDVVYAQIAASEDRNGFFRSANRGESWEKMSDYASVDPQYYMEIYPDPHQFDRIYILDVWMKVTDDGGKTIRTVSSKAKHADNQALLFDPDEPNYLMSGTDGGIYESWDKGKTWKYIANLPVTQFYHIGIDNDFPFYNVYGGTQDNATQGGPSRTNNVHGIRNQDWFNTIGGDGFQVRIDPTDVNILYTQYQYAGIVRYDKKSGEMIDIQPQPGENDLPLKWNWDSPLIISPHSHTRLYFGANRLFRSDDRGDTWDAISTNLDRGIDRNKMEVMGKVWEPEAVWKNIFTSPLGTIVALDESPLQEGLIYVGTDDGLIQVTDNGGKTWRKIEKIAGVPEFSYVADVLASRHEANTVYAVFNNHKQGDFKPYIVKSTNWGRKWELISSDLPNRHIAWSIVEDHEKQGLLFLGTELGLFTSLNNGENWIQLKGGVPVIAFRDLEIQRRENDLVCATFGRGIYILDDYSPLRHISPNIIQSEAFIFPVKNAWMYIEAEPLVWGEKGTQGSAYYTAPNPPFGAVFTYYLKDGLQTRKQLRNKQEQQLIEQGEPISYPSWDEFRLEDREEPPAIIITIKDTLGNVVRRIKGNTSAGIHRDSWNLRYAAKRPFRLDSDRSGPIVLPGTYTVNISKHIDGLITPIGNPQTFQVVPLGLATLPAEDKAALLAFQQKLGRLQRAAYGAAEVIDDAINQIKYIKQAVQNLSGANQNIINQTREIELQLLDLQVLFEGDETISKRREARLPSINERISQAVYAHWSSTSAATTTHKRNYDIAAKAFGPALEKLRILIDSDLKTLHQQLESANVPWTPGRGVPEWQPE